MPSWIVRACVRLYPADWRERYGEELGSLIDEIKVGPTDVIDIARHALAARSRGLGRRLQEETHMTIEPARRHPTALALVGLVVMAPTLAFVVVSMLAYQMGLTGIIPTIEPIIAAATSPRWVDLLLVTAPAIALVLAIAPLVRVDLRRDQGALEAVVGFRLRALNVLTSLVAFGLGFLLVAHLVTETILEAA